jgi:nicotinamidase-related amidase
VEKMILIVLIVVIFLIVYLTVHLLLVWFNISEVSRGPSIPAYASEKAVLLVIDVHEGITGELSNLYARGMKAQSDEFMKVLNKTIDWAEVNKMPIVYTRQETTDFIYNLVTMGYTKKDSPVTQIDKRVKISGSNIFSKSRMDAFSNSEFSNFLRSNEISRLYITGLDALYCVYGTIKGALCNGYKVSVIKDAVLSNKANARDKMMMKYAAEGADILTSDVLPSK